MVCLIRKKVFNIVINSIQRQTYVFFDNLANHIKQKNVFCNKCLRRKSKTIK